MSENNDYYKTITIFFMGIGFLLVILGQFLDQSLFYIALGWEISSLLISIFMQDSFKRWYMDKSEFRRLKRNTKLAIYATKELRCQEPIIKVKETEKDDATVTSVNVTNEKSNI